MNLGPVPTLVCTTCGCRAMTACMHPCQNCGITRCPKCGAAMALIGEFELSDLPPDLAKVMVEQFPSVLN